MESIFDQLFWLWVPLSFLPEWLRLFVVLFVVLQVLLKIAPVFIRLLCLLLRKLLYLFTYPIMWLISSLLRSRREEENGDIPRWIDAIEGLLGWCERFFNKMIQLFAKKKRYRRKWSFYAGTALAVLVTAAVVNNPGEWYAHDWKKTEDWLAQEKPSGYDRAEPVKISAAPAQKEFVLNRQYKDGGNIREAPTLSARRLYTIARGEFVRFLNEEQVDSKGIKWLKVQTANGRVAGWVSANIVREK
ncbi:SH3 domain-containing protein [Neobacillus sp. PS3-12]|uniref:SH3 domain-containing protein n=1 Tax=Neobacillus sp. PS3-12 TaxID=3070677 RepID=UPI0027E215A8|nr:SH3 domain-containing protein [Neobacillus sp. PS3-12]WML55215.1 SH3 domain-containing protein [Neobacillus sp. PS3-12]